MTTFKQFKMFQMKRVGRELVFEPPINSRKLDNAMAVEYPRLPTMDERYEKAMLEFLADENAQKLSHLDTSSIEHNVLYGCWSAGLPRG
jgi:hypothetical protein